MSVIFIPKRSYYPDDFIRTQLQVVVNPVNTVGVMGAGLALKLKEAYPDVFDRYMSLLVSKTLKTGSPVIIDVDDQIDLSGGFLLKGQVIDRKMCLFPTKEDWRNSSKPEYIDYGLLELCRKYSDVEYQGIAIPALGCGLGGLEWRLVKSIIKHHSPRLEKIFGTVAIYEP
jgi:O-acetyl-ADP-ribose deacetylase (regulator of RNase III)